MIYGVLNWENDKPVRQINDISLLIVIRKIAIIKYPAKKRVPSGAVFPAAIGF